jgi:hypothetical protein
MEIQVLPEPNYPVSPDQSIERKTHSEAFTLALQQGLAAAQISSFAALSDWGVGKSSLLLRFATQHYTSKFRGEYLQGLSRRACSSAREEEVTSSTTRFREFLQQNE